MSTQGPPWRRWKRGDEDFSEEIQAHIALEVDRLVSEGLSHHEARAAAHRTFGNVTRTQERFYETQRMMWLHDLRQDLRYALRTLVTSPGFSTVAILTLALGMGANSAIFTIVNAVLFKPLSGQAGELVGLYSHDRTTPNTYRPFSFLNYVDIRDQSGVFDGLLAHTYVTVAETQGDAVRATFVALVSSNYFDTLRVPLAAGRTFGSDEERPGARLPVAIVSYGRWAQANFDPSFIGRTLRIDAEDVTVVGVTPKGFTGTMAMMAPEVFLPLGLFDSIMKNRGAGLIDRSSHRLMLAGHVKDGLDEPLVAARLEALSRQLEAAYPAENKDQTLIVRPMSRLKASSAPQDDSAMTPLAGLVQTLSGVVLTIACLNLANLLLARGVARHKEVALRLALGAKRSRIVRQLLTESLSLAIAGAGLGLVLSYWVTHGLLASLAAVMPGAISFSPGPDGHVLAATTVFASLATIVFGLGPALKLSRRDLVTDLKDPGHDAAAAGRRFGARHLLVIGQIALSLALLTAGGIFVRTTMSAAGANPGFTYDGRILVSLDPSRANAEEPRGREIYRATLERLRALAVVQSVGMASTVPFRELHEGEDVERVGAPASVERRRSATFRIISADYFASLDLKMLRGREFSRAEEESAAAPAVAVIDEALAKRLFGDDDPMGQLIMIALGPDEPRSETFRPMHIVGIAPPIRDELLQRAPEPHLYVPFGRHYRGSMHLTVKLARGMDDAAAIDALRRELRAVDERLPILALSTMQASHDRSLDLWAVRVGGRLFTGLGVLALVLAVVGVYGVKSYVVSQRTREIGIRMALGATIADVLRLVLRDGAYLTGAGLVIGVPLAALVSLAFTKVFVEIGAFDPLVVGLAAAVLALAATTASYLPARRAARVTPLNALRTE